MFFFFFKSLLETSQLCKTTLRLYLIPTALAEFCADKEKQNFMTPLTKAPLPKIPVQKEVGVGQESWHKHWTKSTHVNSVMDFVQLSNLSDGKWSFRKQDQVMISLLFLHRHSIQNKKHNYNKKHWRTFSPQLTWNMRTNTIGINFITLTTTGIRC